MKIIFALTVLISFSSCTGVKPWERGQLTSHLMNPSRDPLTDTVSDHVWFTREAFSGGRGIGGGGCGCN